MNRSIMVNDEMAFRCRFKTNIPLLDHIALRCRRYGLLTGLISLGD